MAILILITFFVFVFLLLFILRSVYQKISILLVSLLFSIPIVIRSVLGDLSHEFLVGSFIALLGMISLLLPSLIYYKKSEPADVDTDKILRLRANSGIIYLTIGTLSFSFIFIIYLYMLFKGEFSIYTLSVKRYLIMDSGERTSLSFLTISAEFFLVLTLFLLKVKNKSSGLYVLLFYSIFITIFVYYVSGNRTGTVIAFILLSLNFIFSKKRKFSIGQLLRVSLIFLVFLIFISYGTSGRSSTENFGFWARVSTGFIGTIDQLSTKPYLLQPEKIYKIHNYSERNELLLGTSFLSFVYAPIPRLVWEDKPSVRIGTFVGREVYKRDFDSGVPPTLVGEAILNFGVPGFLGALSLFGAMFRYLIYKLETSCRIGQESKPILLSLLIVSLYFVVMISDFNGAMLFLIKCLVSYLYFNRYVFCSKA